MLLEFEIENYKSFKDRIKFSMLPAPKQKGLDYASSPLFFRLEKPVEVTGFFCYSIEL